MKHKEPNVKKPVNWLLYVGLFILGLFPVMAVYILVFAPPPVAYILVGLIILAFLGLIGEACDDGTHKPRQDYARSCPYCGTPGCNECYHSTDYRH